MKENFIPVKKTARYFTIGEITPGIQRVWIVLHGYGQPASEFLENFSVFDDGSTLIIAPEGLSKFYTSGLYGNVGASWMTKDDRLNEIRDYIRYLDSIYNMVNTSIDLKNIEVNLLGFSQGTSTLIRWLENSQIKAKNIILWSGSFPDDVDPLEIRSYLNSTKLHLMLGKYDKIIDHKKADERIIRLKKAGIRFSLNLFEGKHEIPQQTLRDLMRYL